MKLSIIVPVYNMAGEGKLEFCLQSILAQTIRDYEIIAVDDASTDNSAEILADYQARYPERFRAIYLPENRKQGGAKNAGLDVACGEYVGFVDSDDFIAPCMYERMLARAEETGADMVGCDYYVTYQYSFEPGSLQHSNRPEQSGVLDEEKYKSLILDTGSLVMKIYKRSLFEEPKLRFPEHMFYEDNAIATGLMLRAKHFEYLQEPFYYYYQHSASTVHTITEERCRNRMDAMKMMLQNVTETGALEQYPAEIAFRFTNLFYQNTLFSYVQLKRGIRLGFLRELAKGIRRAFPDFERNPYYLQRVNAEERKLIHLQLRSSLAFLAYYKLLWWVRNRRNKEK